MFLTAFACLQYVCLLSTIFAMLLNFCSMLCHACQFFSCFFMVFKFFKTYLGFLCFYVKVNKNTKKELSGAGCPSGQEPLLRPVPLSPQLTEVRALNKKCSQGYLFANPPWHAFLASAIRGCWLVRI